MPPRGPLEEALAELDGMIGLTGVKQQVRKVVAVTQFSRERIARGLPPLSYTNHLVFTGNPEGEFFALDARSGNKMWSYQTGAGHRGGAAAYSVNGRQYIAQIEAREDAAAASVTERWIAS